MRLITFPFISFWIFILLINKTAAQNDAFQITPVFEKLTVDDGLSQGFVGCIIQDKVGFLWFATKDGLNKFDGYHITVYRYNPDDKYSLPDNSISQLAEDDDGNFWVGTRNKGLFLFDRLHEHFYHVNRGAMDTILNNPIKKLECRNHKLLVEDYQDVCIYEVPKITYENNYAQGISLGKSIFSFNSLQNSNQLKPDKRMLPGVFWMPDNSIWKATIDSIFMGVPDGTFTHWNLKVKPFASFEMGTQRMFAVFNTTDKNKMIVVGSSMLCVYDVAKKQVVFKKQFQVTGEPAIDYFGNTPFKLANGNIVYYDKEGFHAFDTQSYLSKKYILKDEKDKTGFFGLDHFIDKDQVLWIGSVGYGVFKYNTRSENFQTYSDDARSFFEDPNQNLYFNFRHGTAVLNRNNKSISPIVPAYLWNKNWEEPLVLAVSKNGSVWLQVTLKTSRNYLLLKYNSITKSIEEHTELLSQEKDGQLLFVFTDASNNLWQLYYCTDQSRKFIVTDGATAKVISRYTLPQQKDVNSVSNFLNSYLQDSKGVFWFCTNRGLLRFDQNKNQWQQFNNNPADPFSLSGDIIFSVCADPIKPDKYLWIGTNGRGLNRMDLQTKKCKHFLEKDGLPNNVVYGILNDDDGNLWLSTNQGISCFNIQKETFKNYTREDGLAGNEFNRNQFLKSKSGAFFFGGVDGITWFNPKQVLAATLPASNMVLTGFSISNKLVDYKKDSSVLKCPIQYTTTITLPYNKNMFSFDFALLQFTGAGKKHYKYKLESFDKDWIDNGNKSTATFTNIDPGQYTFKAIGSNSDGVWNEKGVEVKIIITPPWWATWWFRLIMLLAFSSTAYAFYRYRLTQALKLQSLRNRIASDLHDEIGSTISSISLSSTIIKKKLNGNQPEVAKLVHQISDNTENIMEVISDIVWTINSKNDALVNVVDRMRAFAVEILEPKNITIHFNIVEAANQLSLDMDKRKNLYLIFKECINNTAKYSQCNNVWIDLNLVNKKIILEIKDDGIGFDLNEKQKSKLSGNGLYNMEKRAYDMQGKLSLQSQHLKGTTLLLEIAI